MDAEFWLGKWEANQIGFHEPLPHPQLATYWPVLELARGARVFVPLCGKSNDLRWLHERGFDVVGIELSAIAVEAFFAEQGMAPKCRQSGALSHYSAPGYSIYCGDIFDLARPTLGDFAAIYDRAALIALPPTMREHYVAHLSELAGTGTGTDMLLITVDYDQSSISPPPFVVDEAALRALYDASWTRKLLATGVAEVKGQPALESVYQLTRG